MYETDSTITPQHPSPKQTKSWRRLSTLLVFFVALAISISAGLVVRQLLKKDSTQVQTLTLYYNDGQTTLWQTGQEEGSSAAFITYVKDQLKTKHGDNYQSKGAWKVTTTLDKKLQDAAISQMLEQRQNRQKYGIANAGLVAQDVTTGQVVSWATDTNPSSGKDTVREKLPLGTLATPYTYVAFLEQNPAGATATFDDSQGMLPGYICTDRSREGNCLQNLDRKYLGTLTLGQALGGLRNVAAVRTASEIGFGKVRDTAAKIGSEAACYVDPALTEKGVCFSASIFGDGLYDTPHRILSTYATLANQGRKTPQSVILKIILNNKDQYQWQQASQQVITEGTAKTITDVLRDPSVSFFLNPESHSPFMTASDKKAAFVGGYTQDGKLTSTIQSTDKYVVGLWLYNDFSLRGNVMRAAAIPQASSWLNVAD